jgi:alkylation response protein AidB-like acyl-CoA dehydrogenase
VEHQDALARVVADVIVPEAAVVDRDAVYPRHALDALGEAGLLGLISSTDVGGLGLGFDAAVGMITDIATVCASTATVVCMHFAGTAVIEAHGPASVRKDIAAGNHVTTLAFSEAGSRGHFWVPLSTAVESGASIRRDARKSWVTSAGQADSSVWSSRPVAITTTRYEHLDQTLAQQESARIALARAQVETDLVATLLADAALALSTGREDAPLRMLEVKVAAGEAAIRVTDEAMRVCGGAAFRKELGLERRFRDARAARVMAPTTDALLDFIGRAMCGFALLGDV